MVRMRLVAVALVAVLIGTLLISLAIVQIGIANQADKCEGAQFSVISPTYRNGSLVFSVQNNGDVGLTIGGLYYTPRFLGSLSLFDNYVHAGETKQFIYQISDDLEKVSITAAECHNANTWRDVLRSQIVFS